ncbi:hypothetical protein C6569_03365 [Phreatobacter cathodiphilus]|uniref:Uncharacterized protein n=1 Tax=Phreatobacter cathodiphilus TaxID=1868589 RepID=A0A2S0N7P5_9HYPH|nr:hypothetical protein C6569_03365 [Phreatobacter cathodiphilus]
MGRCGVRNGRWRRARRRGLGQRDATRLDRAAAQTAFRLHTAPSLQSGFFLGDYTALSQRMLQSVFHAEPASRYRLRL